MKDGRAEQKEFSASLPSVNYVNISQTFIVKFYSRISNLSKE